MDLLIERSDWQTQKDSIIFVQKFDSPTFLGRSKWIDYLELLQKLKSVRVPSNSSFKNRICINIGTWSEHSADII